jgi:hypothetical protein
MRVLICGGGVIGASIAYFLSRRGVAATVIERVGLASAASGKAGGFLALDWCDGTPLEPLARRSFALHAQLAQELGSDWGYRRVTTYGGFADHRNRLRPQPNPYPIGWLSADVMVDRALGSTETTAQVHPGQFSVSIGPSARPFCACPRAISSMVIAPRASTIASKVAGLLMLSSGLARFGWARSGSVSLPLSEPR